MPSLSNVTINRSLTVASLGLLTLYCVPLVIWQDQSLSALNAIFDVLVNNIGDLYVGFSILMLAASLYFILTKYGGVVLGDPAKKPRFGWFSYLSIIIAMGIGSTIMRTGTVMWAPIAQDPPFGLSPLAPDALAVGNAYAMYIWSFQTFAIFSVGAPAIAYLLFVRQKPTLRMSEIYRCIFGDRFVDGIGGTVIDILFLVSIVAGAATFLGLGTPIVTAIVADVLGINESFTLTVVITLIWIAIFTTSVMLGLEKGIRNLSTFNMYLAAGLGLFILIVGPTAFILGFLGETLLSMLRHFANFFFNIDTAPPNSDGFDMHSYSIFWWAYNATWSLLHSIFAAKISEGRTVRQLLLSYLLAPLFLAWVATAILGGLGAGLYTDGAVPVMEVLDADGRMAIVPEVIGAIPLGLIALVVFSILTVIFFATTLDSTTFTVSAYTETRDMHEHDPAPEIRLLWSFAISAIALVLLRVGGLPPLEVTTGLLGLPIIFIQISAVYAAKKMMDEDRTWERNVR